MELGFHKVYADGDPLFAAACRIKCPKWKGDELLFIRSVR